MAMALTKGISFLKCVGKFHPAILQRLSNHFWADVEMGPPDAILGITEAYRKDTNEKKVNVGVGAYRDDDGKPYVLPVVRCAEERMMEQNLNHEYAPIGGTAEFGKLAAELAFGKKHPVIQDKRYATVQTVSGTGSLRVGMAFLQKFHPGEKTIYMPKPTWGNHIPLAKHSRLEVCEYRYYDKETVGFDMSGCAEDLESIPECSIVLIHACAHNPTGIDPSCEDWLELSKICKKKNHMVYFDMAYQGFASGDFKADAFAVRLFVEEGNEILLSQSFAKNMGLYGERTGALTVVTHDKESAAAVMSQLKILIRGMYSSPPIHGSRIVTEILSDPEMRDQWFVEVKGMADRIIKMRKTLRKHLEEDYKSEKKWKHITDQIGMFAYTGLTPEQVAKITKEFHIYLTKDGRISMAGVSSKNVKYLAKAMHEVTK